MEKIRDKCKKCVCYSCANREQSHIGLFKYPDKLLYDCNCISEKSVYTSITCNGLLTCKEWKHDIVRGVKYGAKKV